MTTIFYHLEHMYHDEVAHRIPSTHPFTTTGHNALCVKYAYYRHAVWEVGLPFTKRAVEIFKLGNKGGKLMTEKGWQLAVYSHRHRSQSKLSEPNT